MARPRRRPGRERGTAATTRPATSSPAEGRRTHWRAPLLLFAAALAVRLLFWQATPDAAWAHSAAFKGDAGVWLEYAAALQADRPFELGLPFRPPGAAYLIAFLSALGLDSVAGLKLGWCVLGALVAPLVHISTVRSFGTVVAGTAGSLTALSTGLLLLSTSLNNETPYLFVAVLSLLLLDRLDGSPRPALLAAWSGLQAAGCLLRAEHALFAALGLAWLLLRWRRRGSAGGWLRPAALAVFVFALVMAPWHARAWSAVHRFNVAESQRGVAERAALEAVERGLLSVPWDGEAQAWRGALPAFARRTAADFVAATVLHRGQTRVRGEDVHVLEEAFGYVPRPLARPFVALYGPLNFALANAPEADGGFRRAPLERPPMLRGGAERYPAALVQGLPPPELSFPYPPHLALVNDGYRLGLRWGLERPGAAIRLLTRKLGHFWAGASLGYTGWNLPLGLSGVRRAVDLVVPEGAVATLWRALVLGGCLFGLWRGWRRPALWPWLLFFGSRAAAAALFFGYARVGATAVPAVGLLLAVALEPALRRLARPRWAAMAVLSLGVLTEAGRLAYRPELTLDGRPLGAHDPFPLDWHQDQRLEVR